MSQSKNDAMKNYHINQKPKILVVYHYFAQYRFPVIRELLQSDRFSYCFAADREAQSPELKVLEETDIPVEAFVSLKNVWLKKRFLWQKGLCRLLSCEEYDAVIFLGDAQFISTWLGAIIARMRGKTIVMWTHGGRRHETGAKGRIRQLFYSLADGLMVYGKRGQDLLIKAGKAAGRVTVIYNSLDYDRQKALRDKSSSRSDLRRARSIPVDSLVVIWVGRIVPGRNLDLLFSAAAHISCHRELRILIVGDGGEKERFMRRAQDLGISQNVSWIGAIHEEEKLAPLFRSADVCVSAGPIGLLAIHALAYGIPVVTHDDFDIQKPEAEAIIPGETGAFFCKGDAFDLARKIEGVASELPISVEQRCIDIVERNYTPCRQRVLIEEALLKWMK